MQSDDHWPTTQAHPDTPQLNQNTEPPETKPKQSKAKELFCILSANRLKVHKNSLGRTVDRKGSIEYNKAVHNHLYHIKQ